MESWLWKHYRILRMVSFLFLYQFSSVTQLWTTLCNSMNYRTPGFPVDHELRKSTETPVHWVSDAIQPSHPLSFPSPPALNVSEHQGLFQWVSSSHQVAKLLEFQLQHQSFQWIFRPDFLYDWLVWSPRSPRDSKESSPTPQFKSAPQFFSAQLSLWSNSHVHTWLLETPLSRRTFVGKVMSLLFNMLSRLFIAFLPRSKHLFISRLQSPSAVILEPQK